MDVISPCSLLASETVQGEQVLESHRLFPLSIIMPGTAQVNTRTVKRAAGPFNPDRVEGERGGQRGTIKERPESTESEVRRVMGGNRGGGGREAGRKGRVMSPLTGSQ